MKAAVNSTVNGDTIGGKLQRRDVIAEGGGMSHQHLPLGLSDTIASFPAIDRGEFEGPMDESGFVKKVYPLTKWFKTFSEGEVLGSIGWLD